MQWATHWITCLLVRVLLRPPIDGSRYLWKLNRNMSRQDPWLYNLPNDKPQKACLQMPKMVIILHDYSWLFKDHVRKVRSLWLYKHFVIKVTWSDFILRNLKSCLLILSGRLFILDMMFSDCAKVELSYLTWCLVIVLRTETWLVKGWLGLSKSYLSNLECTSSVPTARWKAENLMKIEESKVMLDLEVYEHVPPSHEIGVSLL